MSHIAYKLLNSVDLNAFIKNNYEFGHLLISFFDEHFPHIKSVVLKFKYAPECYHSYLESEQQREYLRKLYSANPQDFLEKGEFIQLGDLLISLIHDHINRLNFLVVMEKPADNVLKQFANCIQEINELYKFLTYHTDTNSAKMHLNTTNLVSQISHDINSLITLIPKEIAKDGALTTRINYSEILSRDIMYYLREVTAEKSNVPVGDLLSGIISDIEFPSNVTFSKKSWDIFDLISVDVELFDRALAAIISNAIFATKIEGGHIKMEVNKIKNISPFIHHDWLEIVICDTGPGIPEEYLKIIRNPLFTTWKDQGHVGLGISIADKIIQAHQGQLHIRNEQDRGTRASIYLPIL